MSTVDAERSENWLVRTAAIVGDLSNPFYAEERQRDVWNEASAVALQAMLWMSLLGATAAAWFVGADAVPYIYALLGMVGVASWVAILYARSLGVHVENSTWTSWRRMVPLVVVAGLLALGLVRAVADDVAFDDWSTIAGMVTGAGTVVAVTVVASRYARRKTDAGTDG